VTNLDDAGMGSLRQAIMDTPAGGTVDFQAGLTGAITLTTGELAITKDLTISGPGSSVLTVSGNHASRVFDIAASFTVSISGLTVADGFTTGNGGGIYSAGTLTVTDSTLSGNSATGNGPGYGGGIYNGSGGRVTVTGSTLSGNSAGNSGGGIFNDYGTLTLTACTVSSNSGDGLVNNYGTVTVTVCTVSDNSGGDAGGGIFNQGNDGFDIGTLTLTGCTVSGNSARGPGTHAEGGGVYNTGVLSASNCTFSGNWASAAMVGNAIGATGGGIYNGGTLDLTGCTLTGNYAAGVSGRFGGGIYSEYFGGFTVKNTIVAGNTASYGPDLYVAGITSLGHNLIGIGDGVSGLHPTDLVGASASPLDPLLGPLEDNGGPTLTHRPLPGSPALNAGDPDQLGTPDQRGVVRTGGVNIGAFQASASAFLLSTPDTVQAGVPFDVTVTALDPFGQVAVGYNGTVTFSTTDPDPGVVLPADYPFTADDGGAHTFTDTGQGETTLITPGDQTVTGTDTTDNSITGSAIVTVTTGNAPLPGWALASQPSSPPTAQAQPPARSEPPRPEVVAGDRLFASLSKGGARLAFSEPLRQARAGADSWALDPLWGDEPLSWGG
jgi:hypothetical protein